MGDTTEYALSGAHPVAGVSRECHSESEKGFAAAGPPGPLAALVRIMLFPLRAPRGAITLGNVECATHLLTLLGYWTLSVGSAYTQEPARCLELVHMQPREDGNGCMWV
jgi:hypothetical protein